MKVIKGVVHILRSPRYTTSLPQVPRVKRRRDTVSNHKTPNKSFAKLQQNFVTFLLR